MPVAIKKYKFHTTKTEFCEFIIKLKKLSIDLKKIKAIVNWQELSNITELKSFLEFCNYYQRFIAMWLKNIELFTRLTKKNKPWKWQEEQRTLFKELKKLFTAEPILKIYTPSLLTVIKTDVLDFILGVYLVQKYPDK
jgi:RNase H-like domain found in reverse transcriptase